MAITLKLSGPCPRRWSELGGDGATRFCSECDKHVHDLDALSDEAILALEAANPTGFCGTFVGTGDGVFRRASHDSKTGPAAALAAVVAASLLGCSEPATMTAPAETPHESVPAGANAVTSTTLDPAMVSAGSRAEAWQELTEEQKEERLRQLGYFD